MVKFGESEAELALHLVTPLVDQFLAQSWIRRQDFHLIISCRESDGTYSILDETAFGDAEECANKYRPIAVGKTAITARTGLSSREVQLMRPDLLRDGDVLFWGSAIEGDIIVAGSGVQPWVDEAISKSCLTICMAMIQQGYEDLKEAQIQAGNLWYSS